jgi:Redoxin
MSDLYKRVELLANVAIIVVVLLLGGVLVKQYLLPAGPAGRDAPPAKIKPGTKLPSAALDWGKSDKTLLLVLSTTCKYCTESAPFYRRLAEQKAGRSDVRLVAVLPQSVEESRQYLGQNNVPIEEVTQAEPAALQARATPTLILVDKTGAVVESWVGKLPAEGEAEVTRQLFGARPGV